MTCEPEESSMTRADAQPATLSLLEGEEAEAEEEEDDYYDEQDSSFFYEPKPTPEWPLQDKFDETDLLESPEFRDVDNFRHTWSSLDPAIRQKFEFLSSNEQAVAPLLITTRPCDSCESLPGILSIHRLAPTSNTFASYSQTHVARTWSSEASDDMSDEVFIPSTLLDLRTASFGNEEAGDATTSASQSTPTQRRAITGTQLRGKVRNLLFKIKVSLPSRMKKQDAVQVYASTGPMACPRCAFEGAEDRQEDWRSSSADNASDSSGSPGSSDSQQPSAS